MASDIGKNTKSLPSLDVVLSETKTTVEDQTELISSADLKLGVLLGLSGIILVALLSSAFVYQSGIVTRIFLAVAVVLVLISLVFTILGYWIREYKAPPNPRALREFYLMERQQKTKLAVVDYLCSVYDWNQKILVSKLRYLKVSFICVFSSAIIIGVIVLSALVYS